MSTNVPKTVISVLLLTNVLSLLWLISTPSRHVACEPPIGKNIVFVYAGRWNFIRIQFPYLFRDLRTNGGVVDAVVYIKIKMDAETEEKLAALLKSANSLVGKQVFKLRLLPPRQGAAFQVAYSMIIPELMANPLNKYFKLDDDIVYIHPNAFQAMLTRQDSSKCLLHFANTVSSNWRCSIIHQRMGLFDSKDINPDGLKFDDDFSAQCGWSSLQCNELTLKAFLHYYSNRRVESYCFKGLELLTDMKRFSINFYMLDAASVDTEAIMRTIPINADDEQWWTVDYTQAVGKPNCVVGEALAVHFSYFTTIGKLLDMGYIAHFDTIVQQEVTTMPSSLWKLLQFKQAG